MWTRFQIASSDIKVLRNQRVTHSLVMYKAHLYYTSTMIIIIHMSLNLETEQPYTVQYRESPARESSELREWLVGREDPFWSCTPLDWHSAWPKCIKQTSVQGRTWYSLVDAQTALKGVSLEMRFSSFPGLPVLSDLVHILKLKQSTST